MKKIILALLCMFSVSAGASTLRVMEPGKYAFDFVEGAAVAYNVKTGKSTYCNEYSQPSGIDKDGNRYYGDIYLCGDGTTLAARITAKNKVLTIYVINKAGKATYSASWTREEYIFIP